MKPDRVLLRVGWVLVALLVLVGLQALFGRTFVLTRHLVSADAELPDPGDFNARYATMPFSAYGHLATGLVMVVLGPLQFVPAIRRRRPRFHRWSGRLIVAAGVVAGVSGIVIGVGRPFPGPDDGFTERTAILLIAPWFLFCLARGVWLIRQRQVARHRVWMIRMFAMALAPPTERVLLIGALMAGYDFPSVFGATFWMAAVINGAAAEVWIHYSGPSPAPRKASRAAAPAIRETALETT